MGEFVELLKFLHGAGSSVLPWSFLALSVYLVVTLKPHLAKYIESRNDAKMEYIKKEGERNEIIRNCSATIEACTAALEMVSHDRESIINHIDEHENLSRERMERIQEVVDHCKEEIIKGRGDMKALKTSMDYKKGGL